MARKEYYVNEFTQYKNDIKKAWETLKGDIRPFLRTKASWYWKKINNIADKFNAYFTQIGPGKQQIQLTSPKR